MGARALGGEPSVGAGTLSGDIAFLQCKPSVGGKLITNKGW